MSVEINIFLRKEKLPTPQQWSEEIKAHGFAMEMDIDFDIVEHEGFLPCKYKDEDAGFEYWTEDVDLNELLEEGMITPEEAAQLGDRCFMVTLTTYAEIKEYMTAMIASAVLCEISDGMLAEGGEPPFISAGDAVNIAKDSVPEIEKDF